MGNVLGCKFSYDGLALAATPLLLVFVNFLYFAQFSELTTACFFRIWLTKRSPFLEYATTNGVVRCPKVNPHHILAHHPQYMAALGEPSGSCNPIGVEEGRELIVAGAKLCDGGDVVGKELDLCCIGCHGCMVFGCCLVMEDLN